MTIIGLYMTKKSSIESMKGLSFERLQTFLSIVEAGTMVEAAERDPIRQSLFSRQIRELQNTLGTELFKRDGKFLKLTEAGNKLALATNHYLAALADLADDPNKKKAVWKLGANESVLKWLVFPMVGEILPAAERNPFEFHNLRTAEVVEQIKNGSIDIGILRADAATDAVSVLPFAPMEYVLIVPRSLLPGKSAAGIHHLSALPIGLLLSDGQFVSAVSDLTSRNGVRLEIRLRAQSLSLLAEAVRSSEIAAFLPIQSQSEFPTDRFTAIKLPGNERLTRAHKIIFESKAASMRPAINKIVARLSRGLLA